MQKLKLINGWTKRKVMNRIKKYNNGKRAVNYTGDRCVYLAPNGNRCAIGCFIPDSHSALCEKCKVESLIENYPDLTTVMPFEVGGLVLFQTAHDDAPTEQVHREIKIFLDTFVE